MSYRGFLLWNSVNKLDQNNSNPRELIFEVSARSHYPRKVTPPCFINFLTERNVKD